MHKIISMLTTSIILCHNPLFLLLGIMMVDAMKERGVENAKVIALGYPATYGGYPLSIEAFRNSIDSSIDIVKETPLARPDLRQSAYMEIVNLIDNNVEFNGVYAMDDDILLGAYDALNDQGRVYVKGKNDGPDAVTLVGTVCNGARELLENGEQYGTTIQAPFLEAALAFEQAIEYIETGKLNQTLRFTPNPIATGGEYMCGFSYYDMPPSSYSDYCFFFDRINCLCHSSFHIEI